MRLRIRRDDEVIRAQRPDERLLRERGVVIVVDEQMLEERCLRRGCCRLGSADQRGEVDDAIGVQHVEILLVETSELVPAAQPSRRCLLVDLFRGQPSLLRPEEELPDLVGEPAERQEVSVGGPFRGVLPLEQILDECELVGRGEDIGRLRVAERRETFAQDEMPEPVERQDVEAGERCGEPGDQRVASRLPRAARPDDQRDPLGVGTALHETREPLAEDRGFPGSRCAGDQQRTGTMREHSFLSGIGG